MPAPSFYRRVVTATPIPEAELPYRKARRVFDYGAHMMQLVHKRAEDNLDYYIDMTRFLEPGDTIVGARASTGNPFDLFVTRLEYADTGIVVWLGGGGDNVRYLVEVIATTAGNRRKRYAFQMITRGVDVPLILPLAGQFGATLVGEVSDPQEFRIVNNSDARIDLYDIFTEGEFEQTNNCPAFLLPGEECTATVTFAPVTAGVKRGSLVVNSSASTKEAWLSSTAIPDELLAEISIGDGSLDWLLAEISILDGSAGDPISWTTATRAPGTLSFGSVEVDDTSAPQAITVENTGGEALAITEITASGMFSQTNDCGSALAAGDTCTINVRFAPTSSGAKTGALTITTDAATPLGSVALSGTGATAPIELKRVFIEDGNQFATEDGYIRLVSVNWYGMENTNGLPDPGWLLNLEDVLDQIQSMGFNSIRLPLSGDILTGSPSFDDEINPQFVGMTKLQALAWIVEQAGNRGIYTVLDHHRRTAGIGADGWPVDGSYTLTDFTDFWTTLATMFGDNPNVIGADIHNEPHDGSWADWKAIVEHVGDAIHEIAPDWLIFVEGAGNTSGYWWGENLTEWLTDPIELAVPNRLVASPHEYGQSVATGQPWLSYGSGDPSGWPNNLYARRTAAYGFIFEGEHAPVWVGEWGGFLGYNADGFLGKPYKTQEEQWIDTLIRHMNGYYTEATERDTPSNRHGMSGAYFAWNASSADTGGLVQHHTTNGGSTEDWVTPIQHKLDVIEPFLTPEDLTPVGNSQELMLFWEMWWSGVDVPAGFVEDETGTARVANLRIPNVPDYVDHLVLFSMDPDTDYVAGSLTTLNAANFTARLGNGMVWPDTVAVAGQTFKDAVTLFKANHPNGTIWGCAGGGGLGEAWDDEGAGPAFDNICDFVKDAGLQGLMIDYEPADYDMTGKMPFIKTLISGFRSRLPREDGYKIGICTTSVGCYGEAGSPWENALPGGFNTGTWLPLAGDPVLADLDYIQIMSYDTATNLDVGGCLAAWRHYFSEPHLKVLFGVRSRGPDNPVPENETNIYFTKSIIEGLCDKSAEINAGGGSIYAAFWPPYPQDQNASPVNQPSTSDAMPSAIQMAHIVAAKQGKAHATDIWTDFVPPEPPEGEWSNTPPAAFYVGAPDGTTAQFMAEQRNGSTDGFKLWWKGTLNGAGALFLDFTQLATGGSFTVTASNGDVISAKFDCQVDQDIGGALSSPLQASCTERNSSNGWIGGRYEDYFSSRLTLTTWDCSHTCDKPATTHVTLELSMDDMPSGTEVDVVFWLGNFVCENTSA